MFDPQAPDFRRTPNHADRKLGDFRPFDPQAFPSLTIVTPFCDTDPALFEESVRSVRNQTFQQFSWLIVDDGSRRDDSLSSLDSVATDPRIEILRHESNRGLSAARNTGFEAATTDLVLQLDSDDLLEPTAAEKWIFCLRSHPRAAFCKGFTVVFGGLEYSWTRGFHHGRAFLARNQTEPTAMLRRSTHRAVGGFDEDNRKGLEDWDFWLRCASSGLWGCTLPEYLSWYRRTDATPSRRWQNWDEGRHQREFRRQLRRRYPALWRGSFPTWESMRPAGETVQTPENRLHRDRAGVLALVTRNSDLGEDRYERLLTLADGAPLSIVSTTSRSPSALRRLEEATPDVFALPHFLAERDHRPFLDYLIHSRRIEKIVIWPGPRSLEISSRIRERVEGLEVVDLDGARLAVSTSSAVAAADSEIEVAKTMGSEEAAEGLLVPRCRASGFGIRVYLLADRLFDPLHRWLSRQRVGWHRSLVERLADLLLRSTSEKDPG